jgi:tetratricopeptide (TPR) repeat protein
VSARGRVFIAVALAAIGAAGLVIAGVEVTRSDAGKGARRAGRLAGYPPVVLDLGIRTDRDAQLLRRASALYDRGLHDRARRLFERSDSLEGRVGAAFASWPDDSLARLERMARRHPRSAFVLLHLGLARFWAGRRGAASSAWREALRRDPDTASAVRGDDLLHPNSPRGRPTFIPSFGMPPSLARLSPPQQLRALARMARTGGVRGKLLYGIALQRLERPESAERQYAAAARLAPRDAEAQVAAAVGLFSKENPTPAFSHLGPLTRRFPRATTVRFHLALLLYWIGQPAAAGKQLRRAVAEGPDTPLGREAKRLLDRLERVRTDRPKK